MSHQHQATDLNHLADIAGDTAMHLLDEGLELLQGFVEGNDLDKLPASHAILIAAFALLKQREAHYEERRAEGIAAHASGNQDSENEEQRHRDYVWLKWLFDKAVPGMSETEYRDAITRIVRLTGV
jgi:hypothetical protein